MAKLRSDMVAAHGMLPRPGGVLPRHKVSGVEALSVDEETTSLIEATVEELVAMSGVNSMPAGDPRKAVKEMVRRLKDDTYPRWYTYAAAGGGILLGGLIGWALGR